MFAKLAVKTARIESFVISNRSLLARSVESVLSMLVQILSGFKIKVVEDGIINF